MVIGREGGRHRRADNGADFEDVVIHEDGAAEDEGEGDGAVEGGVPGGGERLEGMAAHWNWVGWVKRRGRRYMLVDTV